MALTITEYLKDKGFVEIEGGYRHEALGLELTAEEAAAQLASTAHTEAFEDMLVQLKRTKHAEEEPPVPSEGEALPPIEPTLFVDRRQRNPAPVEAPVEDAPPAVWDGAARVRHAISRGFADQGGGILRHESGKTISKVMLAVTAVDKESIDKLLDKLLGG